MTSSGLHSFYSSWNASSRSILEEMRISFPKTVHYALLLYPVTIKIIFYFTLQSEHPVNFVGVLGHILVSALPLAGCVS